MMLTVSCGKKLVYFQEKEGSKNSYEQIQLASSPIPDEHIIAYGDALDLKVYTRENNINELFNKSTQNEGNTGGPGFIVDEQGQVFLPKFGNFLVAGKSIKIAETLIRDSMETYLTDFQLVLKLNGIRVTMLGAVTQPGIKFIPGDKATILDALGVSGDLAPSAKPMNIKIIRNTRAGKKTIIADLSDIDIFRSEAFYLHSNDVIYFETQKRRFVSENIQFISIVSTISNLITIILFQFR
jgi:polysaccharide export outer membrane protein